MVEGCCGHLAGARCEELRGVFGGNSLFCRRFAVQSVRGGLSESGRSEGRLASRQVPVSVSKQRRLVSKDVCVRASENGSEAELDPREGGDKLVRVISKDAEASPWT